MINGLGVKPMVVATLTSRAGERRTNGQIGRRHEMRHNKKGDRMPDTVLYEKTDHVGDDCLQSARTDECD